MTIEPANFGISAAAPGAYRLVVRGPRDAALYQVEENGEREVVTAVCWSILAKIVEADWNARLVAKGQPAGAMPMDGGGVLIHRQFGRELDVLLSVAASYQEGEEMARLWTEATPAWRLELWKLLCGFRAEIGTFAYSSQDLQELLRQRAADGSEDAERQERIFSRRREAMDRIRAERKGKPGWKVPKVRWRR